MRMTPLHIQMLLHYHSLVEPYSEHDESHKKSVSVKSFRVQLWQLGLIQPVCYSLDSPRALLLDIARHEAMLADSTHVAEDHGLFTTTARGKVMVNALVTTASSLASSLCADRQ